MKLLISTTLLLAAASCPTSLTKVCPSGKVVVSGGLLVCVPVDPPSPSPSPSALPTPAPTPTVQPTPTPNPTNVSTPSPVPTAVPTPFPTPVPEEPKPQVCGLKLPAQPVPLTKNGMCGLGMVREFGPNNEPLCVGISSCGFDVDNQKPGLAPGPNMKCLRREANGIPASPSAVPWLESEELTGVSCTNFPQSLPRTFASVEQGKPKFYLQSGFLCEHEKEQIIGCVDAWGRRVSHGSWQLIPVGALPPGETWWWLGNCPPQAVTACTTTPSPQPTPVPQPTPIPNPTAAPIQTCTLPSKPECGAAESFPGSKVYGCCDCNNLKSIYKDDVHRAIKTVHELEPHLITADGRQVKAGYEMVYRASVVRVLKHNGFCATPGGPDDEIGVKRDNGMNEQYDIMVNDRDVWHPSWGFMAFNSCTCKPARF